MDKMAKVSHHNMRVANLVVKIDASMLASLLGLGNASMHAKVPVHMGRLLGFALGIGLESPTALAARGSKVVV